MVDVRKLKVGSKVVVVSDYSSHREPIGRVLTVRRVDVNISVNENCMSYLPTDLNLYLDSLEDINDEISREKERINQSFVEICGLKEKLEYLNETKFKEFDEDEFKIYSLLKNFSKESTQEEKTKTLIDLLNN